jgi:hypothetical protein
MKIECEISESEMDGSRSVCALCTRCGHTTESYGVSARSVRRCLALMREECPEDERNFYTADEESLE